MSITFGQRVAGFVSKYPDPLATLTAGTLSFAGSMGAGAAVWVVKDASGGRKDQKIDLAKIDNRIDKMDKRFDKIDEVIKTEIAYRELSIQACLPD